MKELICKRIDDIIVPELEILYEIGINNKENTHKSFMSELASTIQKEYPSIDNCKITTTKIADYKIIAIQFYIICGEEMFAKIIMYSNNLHRTGVFNFSPRHDFNVALSQFIKDFKSDNRQNKIRKILN